MNVLPATILKGQWNFFCGGGENNVVDSRYLRFYADRKTISVKMVFVRFLGGAITWAKNKLGAPRGYVDA